MLKKQHVFILSDRLLEKQLGIQSFLVNLRIFFWYQWFSMES